MLKLVSKTADGIGIKFGSGVDYSLDRHIDHFSSNRNAGEAAGISNSI